MVANHGQLALSPYMDKPLLRQGRKKEKGTNYEKNKTIVEIKYYVNSTQETLMPNPTYQFS